MPTQNLPPSFRPTVTIAELAAMRTKASSVVSENRAASAAPSAKKVPPVFNSTQLAALCGIDRNKLDVKVVYLMVKKNRVAVLLLSKKLSNGLQSSALLN